MNEFSVLASLVLYIFMIMCAIFTMRIADRKNSIVLVFICMLIISIPEMFRYNVGKDFMPYYDEAMMINTNDGIKEAISHGTMEPSYAVIMFVSLCICGTPMLGFAIYALLTQYFFVFGIWSLRRQFRPDIVLFVYLVDFYFRTYNIMRQALAVAIVFYALKYILSQKYAKYMLFVIIATLFHKTAIVAVLLIPYFSRRKHSRIYTRIVYYAIPCMCLLFYDFISIFLERYGVFTNYFRIYSQENTDSIFTIGNLLLLSEIVAYVICRKEYKQSKTIEWNQEDESHILVSTFKEKAGSDLLPICDRTFFLNMLFILFSAKALFVARIGLYFSVFSFYSISIIWKKKERTNTMVFRTYLIADLVLRFTSIMLSNGYGQLPYTLW